MNFQNRLKAKPQTDYQPEIFNLAKRADKRKLAKLLNSQGIKVVDNFKNQNKELFGINNPKIYFSANFEKDFSKFYKKLAQNREELKLGRWIFFPWSSTLVHILSDHDFQKVRTARNRNLITDQEQSKFYNSTVGIAGLSVGNSVALAIVLQGGAKHIKLADHDTLELSNTNRIRGSITNLGLSKVEMTARQIYEINPYAKVEIFKDGLTEQNIERFFRGLNVVIDEVDNLAIKYLIRVKAKKYRLPVVMAADNGDNGVIDIERYDLKPETKFFHGKMGNVDYQKLNKLNKFEIGKRIVKHLGPENITQRTYESFFEMGKSLVSWPQLGGAALLNGSIVAYSVRKILNQEKIVNIRSLISLDELLIPNFNLPNQKNQRMKIVTNFKHILDLN